MEERFAESVFSPVSSDSSNDSYDSRPTPKIRPRSMSFLAVRQAVFQLTCLNDFTLEKIGAGFFADVYKVTHKTSGEVMVLKMNKNRKNSKQMLAEIQLLNRLSHPNILKFKGSCVHEGQLHALTEYINGGTLEDLLQNTDIHLSWSVRTKLAHDIASGMAYLHSKGVFHRDLTSKNCLIKKEDDGTLTAIVSDFGLAAKIKHKRRSYTETVGSPYWMAPECLRGREYCEQADVFSYGIVLAEILTRVSADPDFLPRTQQFGVDWKLLRPMCEGCPQELWHLVSKSCQLDPDDRPTFDEIVHTLEQMDCNSPEPIELKLKSSQSTPVLSTSTSLVSDHAPTSPSLDLEAQLSSLLEGNCSIAGGQPLRNDFILPHLPLDRDSGIDPGMCNDASSYEDKTMTNTLPMTPPFFSPKHSHQASDSSDVSFHLPPPSLALAPPPSPVHSCRASLSDPSSPMGSFKPSLSSLDGSYSSPEASPHIKHRKMSPSYFFCSCSLNHCRSRESILEEDSDTDKDISTPLKSLAIQRTTSSGERCVCDKRKLILSSLSYSTPNIPNH